MALYFIKPMKIYTLLQFLSSDGKLFHNFLLSIIITVHAFSHKGYLLLVLFSIFSDIILRIAEATQAI